jgi:FAD/FMN-containing dehydrogenase
MKKIVRSSKKRTAVIALVVASAGVLGGQKVVELSADPVGEKDCPPLVAAPAAAAAADPVQPAAQAPQPVWAQKGGTINDASCLNRTPIYGIVRVKTVDDIKNALQFAQANGLKISIAGVRHSMGGQAFYKNAVVLDMTGFNTMSLDEKTKVLTVQSGATWHDIQNLLHPKYAVKAMQSTDIFSVGGSISVNAHGMDHQVGSVGKTIRSMRVMLPDGSIQRVSRTENPELFDLVVGGYGLFGIVLEVELDVTDNVVYATGRQIIDYQAFPELFASQLGADEKLGLFYGHLSTAPQSLLQEMILYTYREADGADAEIVPLGEVSGTKLRRFVINFSKQGSLAMRLKWLAEKYVEPRMEACLVNRNQAMKDGEACLVSRNEPMHDSVAYLKNNLKNETDILQEYYIPRDQFVPFVDGLRRIVVDNQTNLLNASVRVIHREDNFLNYAPADMFAVVLYINQPTSAAGNQRMAKTTGELIDLALNLKGTFFLPYQLYYTPEQLRRAYPQIDTFFAAKRRYDPQLLLTNTFYERYAGAAQSQ